MTWIYAIRKAKNKKAKNKNKKGKSEKQPASGRLEILAFLKNYFLARLGAYPNAALRSAHWDTSRRYVLLL
jgi:hypothetical protein